LINEENEKILNDAVIVICSPDFSYDEMAKAILDNCEDPYELVMMLIANDSALLESIASLQTVRSAVMDTMGSAPMPVQEVTEDAVSETNE
jgi:hypothetical protein